MFQQKQNCKGKMTEWSDHSLCILAIDPTLLQYANVHHTFKCWQKEYSVGRTSINWHSNQVPPSPLKRKLSTYIQFDQQNYRYEHLYMDLQYLTLIIYNNNQRLYELKLFYYLGWICLLHRFYINNHTNLIIDNILEKLMNTSKQVAQKSYVTMKYNKWRCTIILDIKYHMKSHETVK